MAYTAKKRKFVKAIQEGLTGAKAAIQAGYSSKGASVQACNLMKDRDVLAALERLSVAAENPPAEVKIYDDPKAFLFDVMNSESEDTKSKIEAAKALMPYEFAKKGDAGIRGALDEAAQSAFEFFAPTPPPDKKNQH